MLSKSNDSVLLQLAPDSGQNVDPSQFPRYIRVSKLSSIAADEELLFAGKRTKLKIVNFYKGSKGRGRRRELSALNKIHKMLRNESPEWTTEELRKIAKFGRSFDSYREEYVLLCLCTLC